MKSLTEYDIENINKIKKIIDFHRNQINHAIKDVDWRELADIPEFKLEAIIRYKEQNGGTLMEAKAKVESYLISTLPI